MRSIFEADDAHDGHHGMTVLDEGDFLYVEVSEGDSAGTDLSRESVVALRDALTAWIERKDQE